MPSFAAQNLLKPRVFDDDSTIAAIRNRGTDIARIRPSAPAKVMDWTEHEFGVGPNAAVLHTGRDSKAQPALKPPASAWGNPPEGLEHLWMIGLRFRTATGQVVRHHYLLPFKAWCRQGLTARDPCGMPTA